MQQLKLKSILIYLIGFLILMSISAIFYYWWYTDAKKDPAFYENDIQQFEALDRKKPPQPNQIVFVGSSSIKRWDNLIETMAPLTIIQRGFGGARMSHVLHNINRIVINYAPKAVVLYAGENDISASRSPEETAEDYRIFIDSIHKALPNTDIWLLSMKPSKLRFSIWPQLQILDADLMDIADNDPRIFFVDVGKALLNNEGQPDDVYVFDGLHLNHEGYHRWNEILKPLLISQYSNNNEQ